MRTSPSSELLDLAHVPHGLELESSLFVYETNENTKGIRSIARKRQMHSMS